MKSFTTLKNLGTSLAQNVSTVNKTLLGQLISDQHRYLIQKYFANEYSSTQLTVSQQQFYKLPADYSKLKTITITMGSLEWTPKEILTRNEWDKLNVFPYYGDIPRNFFIYNNQIGIWPIPSTAGNTITLNYKRKVADLTYEDYSVGTLATMPVASTAVTGTTTAWISGGFPQTADLTFQNLKLRADPATGGDGIWYPIQSFTSATAVTLVNPVINAPNVTASTTYTIGQFPLLDEDFHDMIVHGALMVYFSSVVSDDSKYKKFKELYDSRLTLLAEYSGEKTYHVDLSRNANYMNPNLFNQNIG